MEPERVRIRVLSRLQARLTSSLGLPTRGVLVFCVLGLVGCAGHQTQHDGVGTVGVRTTGGFCVSGPTIAEVCFEVTDDTASVRLGDCVKVSYASDDVAGTGGDLKSLETIDKSRCSSAGSAARQARRLSKFIVANGGRLSGDDTDF